RFQSSTGKSDHRMTHRLIRLEAAVQSEYWHHVPMWPAYCHNAAESGQPHAPAKYLNKVRQSARLAFAAIRHPQLLPVVIAPAYDLSFSPVQYAACSVRKLECVLQCQATRCILLRTQPL